MLVIRISNYGEEYTIYLAFVTNESITGEFTVGFMSRKWSNTIQFDSEKLIQADNPYRQR